MNRGGKTSYATTEQHYNTTTFGFVVCEGRGSSKFFLLIILYIIYIIIYIIYNIILR